jgi:hypothetical protein
LKYFITIKNFTIKGKIISLIIKRIKKDIFGDYQRTN